MDRELSDSDVEREVKFACAAARWAGERVLALRGSGRWSGDILADIGDQAADGLLQGLIRGRYPDDGLLSEETVDSAERLTKRRCWIVDPLDGTREFRDMREDWAVHVALVLDGRCALAAMALPSIGSVLWGVALPGRERFGIEGGARALVRGDSIAPDAPRIVVSRSHTPDWVGRFGEAIGATTPIPCGSAGFKVAKLLLGDADVYVHKLGLKEWDTCAPEIVARSLGWTVCKLRGEEHRYNQADPKNHELVVCRPAHKERVLAAVRESGALEA